MKRGYSAFILAAVICLLSFFSCRSIAKKAEGIAELGKLAYSDTAYLPQLKKEWKSSRDYFSLFIRHDRLEPIDKLIALTDYTQKDDLEKLCLQVGVLSEEISQIVALSFCNIF